MKGFLDSRTKKLITREIERKLDMIKLAQENERNIKTHRKSIFSEIGSTYTRHMYAQVTVMCIVRTVTAN